MGELVRQGCVVVVKPGEQGCGGHGHPVRGRLIVGLIALVPQIDG